MAYRYYKLSSNIENLSNPIYEEENITTDLDGEFTFIITSIPYYSVRYGDRVYSLTNYLNKYRVLEGTSLAIGRTEDGSVYLRVEYDS